MFKKVTKFLLITLIVQSFTHPLQAAWNKNEKIYATVISVCALSTTLWAFLERFKKGTYKEQLDMLKKEQSEAQKDKRVLADAKEHIQHKDAIIADLQTLMQQNSATRLLSFEKVFQYFTLKATEPNQTFFTYIKHVDTVVKKLLTDTIQLENDLDCRCALWRKHLTTNTNADLYKKYVTEYTDLKKQLVEQREILVFVKSFLAQHRSGVELHVMLVTANKMLWQAEQKLAQKNISQDAAAKEVALFARCAVQDKDQQFPLVRYAQVREKEKQLYGKLMHSTKLLAQLPDISAHYIPLIEQAEERYNVIAKMLDILAQSITYQQEVSAKFAFELRKEKQEAEIRERQKQVEQQHLQSQANLQQQKNKAQKLENKRAKIKNERLAYQTQQKNILLELERIKNGKVVDEALTYNNKKWQTQLDKTKKQYEQLMFEYNGVKAELSRLQAKQKKDNAEQFKLERKIKELETKIAKSQHEFISLKQLLEHMPANTYNIAQIRAKASDLYAALYDRW